MHDADIERRHERKTVVEWYVDPQPQQAAVGFQVGLDRFLGQVVEFCFVIQTGLFNASQPIHSIGYFSP